MQRSFNDSKILIVDDEMPNVRLLERLLQRAGYTDVRSTTDSREVSALYLEIQPDILLLDLNMPAPDGFAVMEQIRALGKEQGYFPILVLTADITPASKQRALSGGARDFLTKPFDHTEALLRIQNLLETRWLHLQLQNQNAVLEETVRERTQELKDTHVEIVTRLAQASEYRDDDTGQHTQRVGRSSALLAQQLGLSVVHIDLILRAAPLHDVGKIGISDTILLKPGKLTDEEFTMMRSHTCIGAALLANGRSDLIRMADNIASSHHERWDGKGYPRRLAGEDIPLEGRIVAVADVFDALTHERPYKKSWTVEDAVAEILSQSEKQFDPKVVEAFMQLPHADLVEKPGTAGSGTRKSFVCDAGEKSEVVVVPAA